MSNVDRTPDEAFREVHKRYQNALEAGDARAVETAVAEIFTLAEEFFEENPSAELDLIYAATECEERGDWGEAERLYREALSVADVEPMTEYQVHSGLAALYRLQNRMSDASKEYHRTIEAARRADTPILVAMALVDSARFQILEEGYQEAEALVAEALAITADDEAYGQVRATALVARAQCDVHAGELVAAENDLQRAFDLLKPIAEFEIAAGAQRDLARFWSVTATLHDARQDYSAAVDGWQRAVSLNRQIASLPHCASVYVRLAVANSLDGLAKALVKAGRHDEAAAADRERAEILEEAGLEVG